MTSRVLLAITLLATGSCAARTNGPAASTAAAPSPAAGATGAHENLNAVLWMQSALEFEASALQAYRLARLQLDAALKNPSWTAAPEQTGDASKLPAAVVVDVDETVLDNSYYQARMIRDGTSFAAATWDPWVLEARATAIPGAVDFTRYAASRGATVFYVTNRTAKLEPATRTNLAALGFPVAQDVDTVLTRGERPAWEASGKGPRRAHIASAYRILLLVGDDLGDFVADATGTPDQRRARTAAHSSWWGERWIMVPNPSYGSWERAVIGDAKDPIAARRQTLRVEPK